MDEGMELRPIAHATDNGRVAVYVGAAWQELPRDKAAKLRDQITVALATLTAAELLTMRTPS